MSTRPIRVGILGAGGAAGLHYDAYGALGEAVEIVAIADSDPVALERRQRQWHIPRGYRDFAALLAEAEVDVVSVCLPNSLHHPATLAAAHAGKHVLCEKPISLSLEHAEEMIRVCREAGVVLQVGHHLRSDGAAAKAKALIAAGELGRVTYMRLRQAHDWAGATTVRGVFGSLAASGGGTLLDNGCHMFDLATFFGGEVEEVYAHTATLKFATEVEDTAVVSLRFGSGALGTVESAWTATGWENAFAIYGTKGSLEYSNRWREPVLRHRFRDSPNTTWGETDVADYDFYSVTAHARSIIAFIRAVQEEGEVVCTGEDGLAAVRMVLAAYESARTRQPVRLSMNRV